MPSAVQNAVSLIFIHDVTESCSEADRGLQTVYAFSFRREIGNKNTEGFFFFGIYGRERCGQSPVFDLSGFYCFIEHDIFGAVRGRISVIPGSAGNHNDCSADNSGDNSCSRNYSADNGGNDSGNNSCARNDNYNGTCDRSPEE